MKNDLNLITELVATGVKHSHPAAHAYDIGIYFEANGHGTFVVHDHVYEILDKISDQLA
jgi:phosphoacetylglucosamine mutase